MKRLQIYLIILLAVQVGSLSGQEKISGYNQFLLNLSQYRADLLLDKGVEELDSLKNIVSEWKKNSNSEEEFVDFIFILIYSVIIHKNDYPSTMAYVRKRVRNKGLLGTLSLEYYKIFSSNFGLFELIGEAVLSPLYPFKIEKFEIQSEFDFYDLARGDKIGEIGGGSVYLDYCCECWEWIR